MILAYRLSAVNRPWAVADLLDRVSDTNNLRLVESCLPMENM